MIFDYQDLEPKDRYKLISQAITPRPIAWIVTQSGEVLNIAPFSYFTPLSSNPPSVIVSIGHRENGEPKDTLRNIREHKICTICIAQESSLEALHFSSKALNPDESEAEVFSIETESIFDSFPPVIKGVDIAFGCELLQEIDLVGSKTIPLILEIKEQFVADSIITSSKDFKLNCNNLGRVGAEYISNCKRLKAPDFPKES